MSRRTIGSGLLLALGAFSAAQIDPARVVAIVNGEEIKGAAYYRAMELIPNPARPNVQSATPLPTGLLAIDQLIRERLILQLAKKKGVSPTDTEVQGQLDEGIATNPKLLENWQALGKTEAELRAQLRSELAQYKLITNGITVTDGEIDEHYNKYKTAEFTVPRRFQARVIVVIKEEDKKTVDADLAAGKAFDSVARARSVDPSGQIGGILAPINEDQLNANLQGAFKGVGVNQNTPWVQQTANGTTAWAKFRMDAVTPAKSLPLDAKLRTQIRRKLALTKGGVKFDLVRELLTFQSESNVEIRLKEFAEQYKALMDSLYVKQGIKAG